jgi:hypothetical protein
MTNFCRLRRTEDGDFIYVNPEAVRFLTKSGGGTTIWFAGDHGIEVEGAPDRITKILDGTDRG